mgnify:CR=1 FL=1
MIFLSFDDLLTTYNDCSFFNVSTILFKNTSFSTIVLMLSNFALDEISDLLILSLEISLTFFFSINPFCESVCFNSSESSSVNISGFSIIN